MNKMSKIDRCWWNSYESCSNLKVVGEISDLTKIVEVFYWVYDPAGIYLLKVNDGNTRAIC